mgnify:CR=1 FL=1
MTEEKTDWALFVNDINEDGYENTIENSKKIDTLIEVEERALAGHSHNRTKWYIRLTLLFPMIIATCVYFFHDILFDIKIISPATFISSFIIFWNFPVIGAWLQTKPTYVEDLVIDVSRDDLRYKFVKRYTIVTNFFLAGLVMFIVDYTIFQKYNTSELHSFEMIGVIGGVISLYFKIQGIIGKLLLTIFYKMKKRGVRKINSNIMSNKQSEAENADNTSSSVNSDNVEECTRPKKVRMYSESLSWIKSDDNIEMTTV